MPESKIGATRRLQREGRWDEASSFRDEVRSRLRAEGKSKAEANEAAWAAMFEKFAPQPLDSADVDKPASETDELDAEHWQLRRERAFAAASPLWPTRVG